MIVHRLFAYQLKAATRIAMVRSMLLADQPGLGKTYTALGALELAGLLQIGGEPITIIITAPGAVLDQAWRPALETHFPRMNIIDAYRHTRAKRNKRIATQWSYEVPNVILVNHDSMGISKYENPHLPALFELKSRIHALVVDESHLVLPMDYDDAQHATTFWRGIFRLNQPGFMDAKAVRLAISGTPDRGKLHFRFGTWRFILPSRYTNITHQQWLKNWFYTYEIKVPVKTRDGRIFEKTLEKIGRLKNWASWASLDSYRVVRRTKAEVVSELPKKLYVDVDLEFPQALVEAYQKHQQEFLLDDDGTKTAATIWALRAQQFATAERYMDSDGILRPVIGGVSEKRDWLIRWLSARGYLPEGYDAEGGKVVISSQWVRDLEWLQHELRNIGVDSAVMHGGLSINQRRDVQERFQTGELRIVLLSAKLGVGIDLDAADDLILMDIPRDPDVQEQIEDRVHRVSRMHQVFIWRPRTRGTIDMAIAATNDKKFRETRGLMDGARDVEFARVVLGRST